MKPCGSIRNRMILDKGENLPDSCFADTPTWHIASTYESSLTTDQLVWLIESTSGKWVREKEPFRLMYFEQLEDKIAWDLTWKHEY